MGERETWDFFIAHAHSDAVVADELYELLVPQFRTFLDTKEVLPGDDWDQTLARAQLSARVTVVLVSSNTDRAYYQREEIATAINLSRSRAHWVVPVLLDEVDGERIPYGLRTKHGLRAARAGGMREVARALGDLLGRLPPEAKSSRPPGDAAGDGHSRPTRAAAADRAPLLARIAALILKALAALFGKVGANATRTLMRSWSFRVERARRTPLYLAPYLTAVEHAPRAPGWDKNLMRLTRIESSTVRFGVRAAEATLETSDDAGEGTLPRRMQIVRVPIFLDALLAELGAPISRAAERNTDRYVAVLLGEPASGKSILSLQLTQLLAARAQEDGAYPVPVYVNLTHFGGRYPLSADGLRGLIEDSVRHGCRRYLPSDPALGSAVSPEITREVLDPRGGHKILYVFDGLDEMPVTHAGPDQYNRRIAAVGDFINENSGHLFLVTCRRADYVILQESTNNFQIAKFELLPWTRKQFTSYLEVRKAEATADGRQLSEDLLHRVESAYGSEAFGQLNRSPLLAALMCGYGDAPDEGSEKGGASGPPETAADLWGRFVATSLRKRRDEDVATHVVALQRLAIARTLDPERPARLDADSANRAMNGGLLLAGHPNPEFAIKPLQHYLAAGFLYQLLADGRLAASEWELTHPRFRVTFLYLAEIARLDERLMSFLAGCLGEESSLAERAELFELSASALTANQLAASPPLQRAFLKAFVTIASSGNSGHFDLCVRGIERRPEILTLDRPGADAALVRVLKTGSLEAMRRLFRLLVGYPAAHRHVLRAILSFFLRNARLGTEVCQLVQSGIDARWPGTPVAMLAGPVTRGLHLITVVSYLYAQYIGALALATAGIALTATAFEVGVSVNRQVVWWPGSLLEAAIRCAFLGVGVALPWWILTSRARRGLGLQSPLVRLALLVGLGAFVRYVFLIPVLGIEVLNTIGSAVEFAVAALLLLTPVVAIALATWGAVRRRRLPQSQGTAPGLGGGESNAGPGHDSDFDPRDPRLASLLASFGAAALAAPEFVVGVRSESLPGRILRRFLRLDGVVLLVVFGGLAVALLIAHGLVPQALLGAAVTGTSIWLKWKVYDPLRDHRRVREAVKQSAGAALRDDAERGFQRMCAQIANPDVLISIRKMYVDILNLDVRWNEEQFAVLDRMSSDADMPPALRSYLQRVVTAKRRALRQNTNPRWAGQRAALYEAEK